MNQNICAETSEIKEEKQTPAAKQLNMFKMMKWTDAQRIQPKKPQTSQATMRPNDNYMGKIIAAEKEENKEKAFNLYEKSNKFFVIKTYLNYVPKQQDEFAQERMIKKKLPGDQHKYFENGQISNEKFKVKIILIVWNFNLGDCKSRYNLKYAYFAVPLYQKLLSEDQLSQDFITFKAKAQESFKLNQKQIFLFLINGEQLQSLADIPVQTYFVLLSTSGSFHDLSKYKNYIKLEHIFKQLQFPLIELQNDKLKNYHVQNKVEIEFKDVVVDVIDLLSHNEDINGDELEKMVKTVKECQKNNQQISGAIKECTIQQQQQQKQQYEASNVMMVKTPVSQKQRPMNATFSEFSKYLQLKKMNSIKETHLSPTGQDITAEIKMLGSNSRLQFKTEDEYFDENNQDKPLIESKFHDVYNVCEKYYEKSKEQVQNFESDQSQKEGNLNKEMSSKRLIQNKFLTMYYQRSRKCGIDQKISQNNGKRK